MKIQKYFILFLVCLGIISINTYNVYADVVVTSATGGVDISSDKAQNSRTPGYTSLGDIVITEAVNTDFGVSQSGNTLILTAPSNWSFNAGTGSVNYTASRDITSASISVVAQTATITFSTDGTADQLDVLTISGLQVRATSGSILPSAGNILRTASAPGTGVITGIVNDSTNFGSLSQVVGGLNADVSTITASPSSVIADGSTTSTITVTLKDYLSNPIQGTTVNVVKYSGLGTPTITAISNTTNSSGVATFSVKSTTVGDVAFEVNNLTINSTVSVSFLELTQVGIPLGGGSVSVTSDQNQVVFSSATDVATISIPSNVNNATLNLDALIDNSTGTGVLPSITINSVTSVGAVDVVIPASTNVDAGGSWNGVMNAPTVQSNSSVTLSSGNTVNAVVEIGFGNTALTFNKAIRMKFAGNAGKKTGYNRNNVFTEITQNCSADNQTAGDTLTAGGDCKIDIGSDLVVWTKHFTSFVIFVQVAQASTGGGGGSTIYAKPKDYSISINNGERATSSPNVILSLEATLEPSPSNSTGTMVINNIKDFTNIKQEPFVKTKQFNICYPSTTCPYGTYTVYIQFFTGYGESSDIISASIDYQMATTSVATSTFNTISTSTVSIITASTTDTISSLGSGEISLTKKFTRTLSVGMVGEDVKELQIFLNKIGFKIAETGAGSVGDETTYFGQMTANALIKYQEANADKILKPLGLTKGTGIFGATTKGYIVSSVAKEISSIKKFTRTLSLGMTGEDVKELQIFLNKIGFKIAETGAGSVGDETTYFGQMTANALIKYQEANADKILKPLGLTKGTGIFGPTTRSLVEVI